MKTYTLLDNTTDVPLNTAVFKNRFKFDASLLNLIDTSVLYEEFDNDKNIVKRLDGCRSCTVYGIYKFYPNGLLNLFFFDRKSSLPQRHFDPLYNGYRGVYYNETDKIRFDLFGAINELRHIGRIQGTLTFSGDTMYLKSDDLKYPKIYVKRKLPSEYFEFKADW